MPAAQHACEHMRRSSGPGGHQPPRAPPRAMQGIDNFRGRNGTPPVRQPVQHEQRDGQHARGNSRAALGHMCTPHHTAHQPARSLAHEASTSVNACHAATPRVHARARASPAVRIQSGTPQPVVSKNTPPCGHAHDTAAHTRPANTHSHAAARRAPAATPPLRPRRPRPPLKLCNR